MIRCLREGERGCCADAHKRRFKVLTKGSYILKTTGEIRMRKSAGIALPKGKLGVLTVGMGAVATTFMAGVDLIRRKKSEPIGSLTQMGTIRLGKRTEGRAPMIKVFVLIASTIGIIFG